MTSRTTIGDCGRSPLSVDVKPNVVGYEHAQTVNGNGNHPFIGGDSLGGDGDARCTSADMAVMQKYYSMWDGNRPASVRTGNGLQPATIHRQSAPSAVPPFPVTTEIRRDGSYGYVVPQSSSVHVSMTSPQSMSHQLPYGIALEAQKPKLSPPEMQQFSRCPPGYLPEYPGYNYVPGDTVLDSIGNAVMGGKGGYGYRRPVMADEDAKAAAAFSLLQPGSGLRYDGANGGSAADLYQWVREQQHMSLASIGHRQQGQWSTCRLSVRTSVMHICQSIRHFF